MRAKDSFYAVGKKAMKEFTPDNVCNALLGNTVGMPDQRAIQLNITGFV